MRKGKIMVDVTLAELRKSVSFFETSEVVHIIDGRKKQSMGYFVPLSLKKKFEDILNSLEKEKKMETLRRVASASKKDLIGDGAVDDGIK